MGAFLQESMGPGCWPKPAQGGMWHSLPGSDAFLRVAGAGKKGIGIGLKKLPQALPQPCVLALQAENQARTGQVVSLASISASL